MLTVRILTLLLLGSCQSVDGARLRGIGPGSVLEVAVDEYHRPDDPRTVLVIGMVHIAEPAFYQRVQKTLDAAGMVLMEGVRRNSAATVSLREPNEAMRDLAQLLNLEMQTDGLRRSARICLIVGRS